MFTVETEVARMSELVKGMLEGTLLPLFYLQIKMHSYALYSSFIFFRKLTPPQEDADEDEIAEFPLPKVKAAGLTKVIEFCKHYKEEPMTEIEKPLKSAVMNKVVQKWYADFVNVEQVILF